MPALLPITLAALLAAAPAAPPRDPVLAAATAARGDQLKLLEALVNIDSGTGDKASGQKASARIAAELRAIGLAVELVPAEAPGLPDNVVATLEGTGKGRILMIAHSDTVYEPGTAAKRPFRIEGPRAYGPGVIDEKGGVVEGITALRLLKTLGQRDFRRITLLVETSEEAGSPGTNKLMERLFAEADVELNLEPGDLPDAITVWRKGAGNVTLTAHGRAAHSGVAPQDGRNAALELVHQIGLAKDMPASGDGVTVNLTLMNAGTRNNIIPDTATANYNVRVRRTEQLAEVTEAFRRNAATTAVPDTHVEVTSKLSYPPLPDNPATMALAERAERIYAAIGRTLTRRGNGGASESAVAYNAGVPAIDGLGPVGGGAHTDGEFLELSTLTPRLYLLTRLLIDLGANPPARLGR